MTPPPSNKRNRQEFVFTSSGTASVTIRSRVLMSEQTLTLIVPAVIRRNSIADENQAQLVA
jgi:hypothetical protein